MFLFILFSLCISFSSQADDAELSLNFKSNFTFSSIVSSFNTDQYKLNISIDIASDNNILFIPDDNSQSGPQSQITYKSNIFDEVTSVSYIKGNVFLFADNHNKTQYAVKVLMYNVPDPSMNNITDDHIPMSFFGLSRKIDPQFSLVETLFNMKYITKKQFGIVYSYPFWGTITFGEHDDFIREMSKHLMEKVPVYQINNKKYNSKWTLKLKGIFFGEEGIDRDVNDKYTVNGTTTRAVELNLPMYISTVETNIIVPCEVVDYLNEYYFYQLIGENSCRLENEKGKKYFRCRKSIGDKLEQIHFVFGDLDLLISAKRLFNKQGIFSMMCYSERANTDFILGYYFLKSFYTTFSYEDDTISFFSLLGKIKLNEITYLNKIDLNSIYYIEDDEKPIQKKGVINVLIIITIVIMLCGLIYNILINANNLK